jgi:hypothetical protein
MLDSDISTEIHTNNSFFCSNDPLADVAPQFSEQQIYFPADPKTCFPTAGGLEIALALTDPKTGATDVPLKFGPLIHGSSFSSGPQMPLRSLRPPCLISIHDESDFYLRGNLVPTG